VYYEHFLFTRNQRRDFTAFIRPKELTNKDISNIASALNNVNDVAQLTLEWPSLYCFPIGAYVLLLRHYNSGRQHAGRDIGIIEGVAVKRTQARHFALALPYFLEHQDELLAAADTVPNIEEQTMTASAEIPWPEIDNRTSESALDTDLIEQFAARLMDDRLCLPFTQEGRAMLLAALADSHFPRLYFAFGTNAEVLARLNQSDIDVDVVSYFNTTEPGFKPRGVKKVAEAMASDDGMSLRRKPAKPETVHAPTSEKPAEKNAPTTKPNADTPAPLSVRWFANLLARLLKGN
jgi:hypothetical protein